MFSGDSLQEAFQDEQYGAHIPVANSSIPRLNKIMSFCPSQNKLIETQQISQHEEMKVSDFNNNQNLQPSTLAALETQEKVISDLNIFNSKSSEFVPQGQIIKTEEQFPSLDLLENNSPKKMKKKASNAPSADIVKVTGSANKLYPYIGKPSTFFIMKTNSSQPADILNPNNYYLNEEQLNFISVHYPEHLDKPIDHMLWLHKEASNHEQIQIAYQPPKDRKSTRPGRVDDSPDEDIVKPSKLDNAFKKNNKVTKVQAARKRQEEEDERLRIQNARQDKVQKQIQDRKVQEDQRKTFLQELQIKRDKEIKITAQKSVVQIEVEAQIIKKSPYFQKIEEQLLSESGDSDDDGHDYGDEITDGLKTENHDENGNLTQEKLSASKPVQTQQEINALNLKNAELKNIKGNKLLQAKDYTKAIHEYSLSIKRNNKDSTTFSNRATAYQKQQEYNFRKVIEDADMAIKLKSDNLKAYQMRGKAYFALDEYENALKDFIHLSEEDLEKTIEVEKDIKLTKYMLEYQSQNEVKKPDLNIFGEQPYISEVKKDSKPILKPVKKESKKDSKADKNEQKKVDQIIIKCMGYRQNGDISMQQGNLLDAVQKFDKGVEILETTATEYPHPSYREIIYNLQMRMLDNLMKCCKKELLSQMKVEYSSKLIKALEILDEKNELLMDAYRVRGIANLEMNQFSSSQRDRQKVNQLLKGKGQASPLSEEQLIEQLSEKLTRLKDYGNKHFKDNNYDDAISQFTQGIQLYQNDLKMCKTNKTLLEKVTQLYTNRSLAWLKQDKHENSIKDATYVLENIDSSNEKALFRRAQGYEQKGELEKGVDDLEQLLKVNPDNAPGKKLWQTLYKKLNSHKMREYQLPQEFYEPPEEEKEEEDTYSKIVAMQSIPGNLEDFEKNYLLLKKDSALLCQFLKNIPLDKVANIFEGNEVNIDVLDGLLHTFTIYSGKESNKNVYDSIFFGSMGQYNDSHDAEKVKYASQFMISLAKALNFDNALSRYRKSHQEKGCMLILNQIKLYFKLGNLHQSFYKAYFKDLPVQQNNIHHEDINQINKEIEVLSDDEDLPELINNLNDQVKDKPVDAGNQGDSEVVNILNEQQPLEPEQNPQEVQQVFQPSQYQIDFLDQKLRELNVTVRMENEETNRLNIKNGTNNPLLEISEQIDEKVKQIMISENVFDEEAFDEWIEDVELEDIFKS